MEKRVLLAIFLAFLVLYAWQAVFVKPVPKGRPGSATPAATTAASVGENAAQAPAPPVVPAQPTAQPKAPTVEPLVTATAERDVRVETRDVIAIFTNRGARLKSWRLKHYLDQQREPQELVVSQLASQPLPFTLRTPSEATTATLNDALFSVSGESTAESGPTDLRFEYSDRGGLHAVKEFHFDPSSYIVTFRATVEEGERAVTPTILWGPAVGDIGELSRYVKKAEGVFFANEKVSRLAPKDFAKQPAYDGDFTFVGVDDNYFMTVALSPGASRVSYQPVSIPAPAGTKEDPRELVAYSIEPQHNGPIKFFAGPKDFDVLAGIATDVTRAIDFGMFAVLVVPLLRSLKWVNNYVGNYGWAIIILTIMINAIMFPLRHKSVVSMRKMQEIQPEVKAIQDRYSKLKSTDPAKQNMNKEMMTLYRERGVNPASGCVPMLLTFPLIFAFYALLSTAIELRGAPFIWWIHDLSAHDQYYVTPVLMGISQMWQQRIAPQTGVDPAQQKMMMLMPIVFTFIFVSAPSGVAIYWLISNMWAIGQQYLTSYIIGPPKVRAVRPPGSSKMKRVGVGKTEAAARES